MAYSPQTWTNDDPGTPLSAARLTVMETGIDDADTRITSHGADTANPHSVTKTQVGLGNVDNTSDVNKPVSTATQTALDTRAASFGFPSSIDPGIVRGTDAQGIGTANRAIWYRCADGGTVTAIGFQVVVTGGNMSVGFYSNSGTGRSAAPGAPIAVTASTAVPAVGYQTISLGGTFTVLPGDWIAIAADSTTPTFRATITGTAAVTALGAGRLYLKDTSFPLPNATLTGLSAALGAGIVLVGA